MAGCFLHIDMDAFFAAIEQLDHPEFRNKPVVVGADPQGGYGRGVVSTCSYEARVFGIRSAMPISKAYQLCPDAIYVYPRGRRYAEMSGIIMNLLSSFSPDLEQISIDEAFLDISSTYKIYGSPEAIGRQIKEKIRSETNLTASIGIAPVKFVAKIASDLKKPDGLVVVEQGGIKAFLAPLDISRLWGVGPKTLPHLHDLGIHTIGDMARFSQNELIQRFGKVGLHFWRLANGIDTREVEQEFTRKSISKETTFSTDMTENEELRNVLLYLSNELAREMRKKDFKGRTITLKIRLEDFSTFTRSRTIKSHTDISEKIYRTVCGMYDRFDRQEKAVRLLGISISHLDCFAKQLDLFDTDDLRQKKLDRVVDKVREKFGEKSITRASLLNKDRDSQWIRD